MGFCLKLSQRKMQRGENVVEWLERWTRARLPNGPDCSGPGLSFVK